MNILGFFFFYYRIKVINAKKIFNFVMNILYLLVIHNYLKPLVSVTIKMKKIRFQINVNLLILKNFRLQICSGAMMSKEFCLITPHPGANLLNPSLALILTLE